MAALDKLTLTDTTRALGYDPVRVRRRKLAAAIQDQLGLLAAEEQGERYRKRCPLGSATLKRTSCMRCSVNDGWLPGGGRTMTE